MPKKKSENKENIKKTEENEKEIESLILDLAKHELTAEKIGLKLKEKGKNIKSLNLKISDILKKHNLFQSPDIKNLTDAVEKFKKHLEKNKHDYKTKRTLLIKEAKLKKLEKIQKIKMNFNKKE